MFFAQVLALTLIKGNKQSKKFLKNKNFFKIITYHDKFLQYFFIHLITQTI